MLLEDKDKAALETDPQDRVDLAGKEDLVDKVEEEGLEDPKETLQ